jgi:Kef-type K+ transport system membrane component KefB
LIGYATYVFGPKLHLPRVTLLLVIGALAGPSVLDLVPAAVTDWFPFMAHLALAMVGFLLGERFVGKHIMEKGKSVLLISIGETLAVVLVVFTALLLAGASLPMALILAGIGPASAPAAIYETVRESNARGPLTETVLGVVAVDDAWGVLIFSVLFVVAQTVSGAGTGLAQLGNGLWEVLGAVLVGGVLGLLMAWVTGRVREGEPALIEAFGFVFLCSGLATMLHVSYLLACMVLGAVVANRARHYTRPFHAIEGVSEPFLAVFFLLAGFRFQVETLAALGLVGAVYVAARTAGKVLGGSLAARLVDATPSVRKHIGWCILPQAGVALGFALLAKERLPEIGGAILPLVIATTVLFEVSGPLFARRHLYRAGETSNAPGPREHAQ